MERKKRLRITTAELDAPKAYVMPDEPEVTDADIEAMTDSELETYFDRVHRYEPKYDTDPVQDAIESEEFHQWFDGMTEEDFDGLTASAIEKAAAPLIAEAIRADFIRETPFDSAPYGMEIDSDQEAMKLLMLAVTVEVNRWKKPPKAEVTAAGIGLALAYIRKERGIKHTRDIAKEVGVRPQTLFQVRKLTLMEIQRLNFASDLRKTREPIIEV